MEINSINGKTVITFDAEEFEALKRAVLNSCLPDKRILTTILNK